MVKTFIGIQIVGLVFGLLMLYFTNIYYKRNELAQGDAILWGLLWLAFLGATLFPSSLNLIMEGLGIVSAMHFFTVVGFMFMFLVVFFMYKTVRRTQRKTELLVKHIALRDRRER